MAQVITVSPPTAAAVSDSFKQTTMRAANFNPMAAAIADWHAKAVADGDIADRPLLQFVHPPSLALTFLTATHHKVPQTTPEQATAAYMDNGEGK
ncbi:hypothetical protein [Rhizobium sp. C1]|uniref:hypothetical protein n=1 Tax=Rhizobium sp. C1 TaxID=1349799 RepID=UPI001E41947A|nr:hypothetical protein [Rhizobium sp. C1]MCD2176905.1 hypothetical protein [Rhizobium sp. C1]